MKKETNNTNKKAISTDQPCSISVRKLGIVSHDYRVKEENGYRDFSHSFDSILSCLDSRSCDSVLFSLFTIVKRKDFDVTTHLKSLKNIRAIFIEEFIDGDERKPYEYVTYYKTNDDWKEYRVTQKFGTLKYTQKFKREVIDPFMEEVKNHRLLGNCSILLCGETNIVTYSKESKSIKDKYGLFKILNTETSVILNPIHDKMTRFEMKLKRKYLSKNNRYVISIWNKGKTDKNGKVKDGMDPPWTVFHNEDEKRIEPIKCNISTLSDIEIGIVELDNT